MEKRSKITEEQLSQLISQSKLSIDNPDFEENLEKRIDAIKALRQKENKGLNKISIISYAIGLVSGLIFTNLIYDSQLEGLSVSPHLLNSILLTAIILLGSRIIFYKNQISRTL